MGSPTDEDVCAPAPLGILAFGSGLAFVAYVLSGISLAVTLAVVVVAGGFAGSYLWAHSSPRRREVARARARAGVLAGVAALVAYDVSRWMLVEVVGFEFRPFEAFGAFGRALWGAGADGWWVTASGVAFHVSNGLTFALGYTLLARRPGPTSGVVFALGLEVAMVALYPNWLRIQAVDEFLQVSMLGHVAYGATLGWTARALLHRQGTASRAVSGAAQR
jgi:hypothetical protein